MSFNELIFVKLFLVLMMSGIISRNSRAALKHKCDIHAYLLMTNHVPLLVTPQRDERFKIKLEKLLDRSLESSGHGGERRADKSLNAKKQGV